LIIAHPPCTYLTNAAEWCYKERSQIKKNLDPQKLYGEERQNARREALNFISCLWHLPATKLVIENPQGCINTKLPFMPKPQWVQPYMFGDDASKKTGLWTRGLPKLKPTKKITPRYINGKPRWSNQTDTGQNKLPPSKDRWKIRSKTYKGIADALAEQYGALK